MSFLMMQKKNFFFFSQKNLLSILKYSKIKSIASSLKAIRTAISRVCYLTVNLFVNGRIVMYFDKN